MLRARLQAPALLALTELFAANGDLHAACYTGSKAMHSEMLCPSSTVLNSTRVLSL